jgi:hypothetical protein
MQSATVKQVPVKGAGLILQHGSQKQQEMASFSSRGTSKELMS